jgi:hypothetical protein
MSKNFDTMNYQAYTDYYYIDVALKSLWQPFTDLAVEMESFAPRPLSDYDGERQKLFEHYQRLDPTASVESLTNIVDRTIETKASDRAQYSDKFSNRFMTQYIMIIFQSHALCEAAINAILAIGLVEHGCQELFTLIEKADIKEKWRIGPKSFHPSYEFHSGTALFETLNHLTKQRNALVHYKTRLHVDGVKVLDGSKLERLSFQENIRWIRRYFSLPYDLVAHANAQMNQLFAAILWPRTPIILADEHKTS